MSISDMRLTDRPLAFTDVKTTGTESDVHEIIEIGLIVVDQKILRVSDHLSILVTPKHIETATEAALARNCYNEADWMNASSLEAAMTRYAEMTKGAIFCARKLGFTLPFIYEAFKKTGVENQLDYRCIDLWTAAWMQLQNSGIQRFSMNEVARHLGYPDGPRPHRALNSAIAGYEIYKRLMAKDWTRSVSALQSSPHSPEDLGPQNL